MYEGAAVEAASRKNREIRGKFGGNSCLNHPSQECPGGGNILQVHYFTMTSLKYAPDEARTTLTNYQKALGRGGGRFLQNRNNQLLFFGLLNQEGGGGLEEKTTLD